MTECINEKLRMNDREKLQLLITTVTITDVMSVFRMQQEQ